MALPQAGVPERDLVPPGAFPRQYGAVCDVCELGPMLVVVVVRCSGFLLFLYVIHTRGYLTEEGCPAMAKAFN